MSRASEYSEKAAEVKKMKPESFRVKGEKGIVWEAQCNYDGALWVPQPGTLSGDDIIRFAKWILGTFS